MKTRLHKVILTAGTAAVVLTGCQYPNGEPNNTGTGVLAGGAIGAASGAVIGGRNAGAGALIGGAIGALAGGLIGSGMDAQQRAALQAQAPQTYVRINQGQPLGLADIKAMAKAGVSDDVIISQIQSTHSAYNLSSADIIDLHNSGVSDKVVNFMISTQGSAGPATVTAQQAPPPPPAETYVVAPGPGYVWVDGDWDWNGVTWVWIGGHWIYPPYPGAVWVHGYWYRGPHGWYHSAGHWRR